MPFDGKSCLDFYFTIANAPARSPELSQQLARHAAFCTCPCPACGKLRATYEQLKAEANA